MGTPVSAPVPSDIVVGAPAPVLSSAAAHTPSPSSGRLRAGGVALNLLQLWVCYPRNPCSIACPGAWLGAYSSPGGEWVMDGVEDYAKP